MHKQPLRYPYCPSCGEILLDPDVCWCGANFKQHTLWENHGFIPCGCVCGYGTRPTPIAMKKLELITWLPIWFLGLVIQPFMPFSHPWRKSRDGFKLSTWRRYGTPMARELSLSFWLLIILGMGLVCIKSV